MQPRNTNLTMSTYILSNKHLQYTDFNVLWTLAVSFKLFTFAN